MTKAIDSRKKGLQQDYTRASFIIREELLEKLKAIAYWERALMKDVVTTMLQVGIEEYEKKHGAIKPIPKGKKSIL